MLFPISIFFDCHVDFDNVQTVPQACTFLQSIVLYKSYYYYYLKLQNGKMMHVNQNFANVSGLFVKII